MVLARDLPEHGLKARDLGVVVELYEPDGLEVESVTASKEIGVYRIYTVLMGKCATQVADKLGQANPCPGRALS